MRRLVPCSACQRHVFPQEAACPHCGRSSPAAAALAAFAVTAGLALTACERPSGDVYGPPPIDPSRRTPGAATIPTEPSAAPSAEQPSPSTEPSAAPSDTSTSAPAPSAPATTPTTTSQSAPARPPAKVYGPPPRKPTQRDPL